MPEEAAIVRRVWDEVRGHSYTDAAERLNRDGVMHRGPWTRDAVKDLIRRGRVYLGYVVEKRGRDERPGQHEPILTEAEYRATLAAITARTWRGNKPKPYRTYVLRGLVACTCGTRMRGEAHVQRGGEIRYYRCHNPACRSRRMPAAKVEQEVLAAIGEAVLPSTVVDAARAELRRRLAIPAVAVSGRKRARLQTRLEQLKKQHGWGDLSDEDYQSERDAVRAALQDLPDDDRIRSFDAYRTHLLALPEAIAAASETRREELCRMVVQQVVVSDRAIALIEWTAPMRPFLEKRRECPQGDSNP